MFATLPWLISFSLGRRDEVIDLESKARFVAGRIEHYWCKNTNTDLRVFLKSSKNTAAIVTMDNEGRRFSTGNVDADAGLQ